MPSEIRNKFALKLFRAITYASLGLIAAYMALMTVYKPHYILALFESKHQETPAKASADNRSIPFTIKADANANALKEAEERAALLEKTVKDLQRLAELKKQEPSIKERTVSPRVVTDESFDHDKKTRFPLLGKHRAPLKCSACHKGDLYKDKLQTTCIACHEKDDKHKGQEGKKCETCHDERDWHKTTFKHNTMSTFPLQGSHGLVECKKCHSAVTFKDAKSECGFCHKKDDAHAGVHGRECERCHVERGWKVMRALSAATAERYTISTNGAEVTDKKTGLIWQRCAVGMVYNGSTCSGAARMFTNEDMLLFVKSESVRTGIAWRLPYTSEYFSIADREFNPTINPILFPNTPFDAFWSATLDVDDPMRNVLANFIGGGHLYRKYAYPVRLVRGGDARFTISTDGTEVTDKKTGLIWRRCAEGMRVSGGTCMGTARKFTYDEALQHAKTEAGRSGIAWRVPGNEELGNIIDKAFSPAVNPTSFQATPSDYFWSSSPVSGYSGNAFSVNFYDGRVLNGSRGNSYYVRLVRTQNLTR